MDKAKKQNKTGFIPTTIHDCVQTTDCILPVNHDVMSLIYLRSLFLYRSPSALLGQRETKTKSFREEEEKQRGVNNSSSPHHPPKAFPRFYDALLSTSSFSRLLYKFIALLFKSSFSSEMISLPLNISSSCLHLSTPRCVSP